MTEQHPFKWRHFQSDLILLCVRWYLRYALSYRDLEEMMAERGFLVDHTTIYRWVQGFEVMNMIRKGQIRGVEKRDVRGQAALIATLFGVAA